MFEIKILSYKGKKLTISSLKTLISGNRFRFVTSTNNGGRPLATREENHEVRVSCGCQPLLAAEFDSPYWLRLCRGLCSGSNLVCFSSIFWRGLCGYLIIVFNYSLRSLKKSSSSVVIIQCCSSASRYWGRITSSQRGLHRPYGK